MTVARLHTVTKNIRIVLFLGILGPLPIEQQSVQNDYLLNQQFKHI